jgi:hypothetical protein
MIDDSQILGSSEFAVPSFKNQAIRRIHSPHYKWCNFVRVHQTLSVTPAMTAGVSNHVWSFQQVAALPAAEKPARRAA